MSWEHTVWENFLFPKSGIFFNAVRKIFLIFVHKHEQGIQELPYLHKMGQEFRKFAVIALLWLYWPHSMMFQFFLSLRHKIFKVLQISFLIPDYFHISPYFPPYSIKQWLLHWKNAHSMAMSVSHRKQILRLKKLFLGGSPYLRKTLGIPWGKG